MEDLCVKVALQGGGGGIDVYEVLIRLYFLFCLFPLYANLTSGIIIVQSLFCTNLGCYL